MNPKRVQNLWYRYLKRHEIEQNAVKSHRFTTPSNSAAATQEVSVIVVRASRPLLRALQRHRFYFRERTYRCDYPRCARWARPATRSAVRSPRTGKCWRRRRRRRCLSWSLLHWRAVARGERKGDRTHSHARTVTGRQTAAAAGAAQDESERRSRRERRAHRHTSYLLIWNTALVLLLKTLCVSLFVNLHLGALFDIFKKGHFKICQNIKYY